MRYIYGGEKLHIAILPGGNLLYSHFPAYPGKGGKWLLGENGSITPASLSSHQLVACFRNDIRSIVHLSLKLLTHPINGSFFFYISDR
jgi:hypothetical protein